MGGFKMFVSYVKAVTYAETFPFNYLYLDPAVDRWCVQPLERNYV